MRLVRSLVKNWHLSKIMKRLSPPNHPSDIEAEIRQRTNDLVSASADDRKVAFGDLMRLVRNDSDLSAIMARHGANERVVEYAYKKLVLCGAGQWVRGAYVPAAAIATNPSLDHLLGAMSRERDADEHQFWLKMSVQMLDYFGR